jgi:DNA polymerase III delta subunit
VPSSPSKKSRGPDPFEGLAPLLAALREAPLPPVLFVHGDDEWIVGEAARRVAVAFGEAFPQAEVTSYEATGDGVREAVADAATIALFATNRLVVLAAGDLFRARKLTAEEIDLLLDEAAEAGNEPRVLSRLARKARSLAAATGVDQSEDPDDAARRMAGRVRRSERAADLAALLSIPVDEGESTETALDHLVDYVARATASDNVLLVHAVSPDPAHRATQLLARSAPTADLTAGDDGERSERLAALGFERALERHVLVELEVFETLAARGRLSARAFLQELDRLIETASSGRVTGEDAARLVVDERKEYGSDFVEAVAGRRPLEALHILERLLGGGEFTAFRPFRSKDEAPAKKGPRGEAAFFPLLGLLAAEIRRMLLLKAAVLERGGPARRMDYRTFADRLLPSLKAPRAGLPPLPLDAHPYVLHKGYVASLDWSLSELKHALTDLEAIDRGVKVGAGSGSELLEAFLLARAAPRQAESI